MWRVWQLTQVPRRRLRTHCRAASTSSPPYPSTEAVENMRRILELTAALGPAARLSNPRRAAPRVSGDVRPAEIDGPLSVPAPHRSATDGEVPLPHPVYRPAPLDARESARGSPTFPAHATAPVGAELETRDGLREEDSAAAVNPSLQPALQCPFCVSRVLCDALRSARGAFARASLPGVPARHRENETHGALTRPYSPVELYRHLSYQHAAEGYSAQHFSAFNEATVQQLARRVMGLPAAADVTAAPPARNEGSESAPVPAIRLIVLVDLANVALDNGSSIATLLDGGKPHGPARGISPTSEAVRFFSSVPAAICLAHEVFIPHTVPELAVFYRLAQLHPGSAFFPFYSVSELEAGDLAAAAMLTKLTAALRTGARHGHADGAVERAASHRRPSAAPVDALREEAAPAQHDATTAREDDFLRSGPPPCPPVVLITKDLHQRACMAKLFPGTVFNISTGGFSRTTIMEVCRRALLEGGRR